MAAIVLVQRANPQGYNQYRQNPFGKYLSGKDGYDIMMGSYSVAMIGGGIGIVSAPLITTAIAAKLGDAAAFTACVDDCTKIISDKGLVVPRREPEAKAFKSAFIGNGGVLI